MAGFYMGIKLFRFEIQLPDCPESFDYADNIGLLLILDLKPLDFCALFQLHTIYQERMICQLSP